MRDDPMMEIEFQAEVTFHGGPRDGEMANLPMPLPARIDGYHLAVHRELPPLGSTGIMVRSAYATPLLIGTSGLIKDWRGKTWPVLSRAK